MALEALAASLPAYAGDLALNLASLLEEPQLTSQQKWGCFVASAHAVATPAVVKAIEAAAAEAGLSDAAKTAAKGAAAIMAQNNIYFRALRARLRMKIVSNPGVERDDFDLWCVAVSAIHGCPDCLDAHESNLSQRGVDPLVTQTALRIAAVVHAVSRVVAGEAAAV